MVSPGSALPVGDDVEGSLGPLAAEHGEREGGYAHRRVLGPAIRNRVPEAIAQYLPMISVRAVAVEHVGVLEAGRIAGIVIVGVVADDDLGELTSGLRNTTRWCADNG